MSNVSMHWYRSIAICLIMFSSNLSALAKQAEVGTPSSIDYHNNDRTLSACGPPNYGISDEKIRLETITLKGKIADITIESLRFKVPYEYLTPHPGSSAVDCRNYWKTFGFSFWWPDPRPAEYDGYVYLYNRPQNDQQNSLHNNSIVIVTQIAYINVDSLKPRETLPSERIENTKLYLSQYKLSGQKKYGLLKYESSINGEIFVIYGSENSENLDVFLRCAAQDSRNAKCFGKIYIPSENIIFNVAFLKELIPEIQNILLFCRTSLKSWQVEYGQ